MVHFWWLLAVSRSEEKGDRGWQHIHTTGERKRLKKKKKKREGEARTGSFGIDIKEENKRREGGLGGG